MRDFYVVWTTMWICGVKLRQIRDNIGTKENVNSVTLKERKTGPIDTANYKQIYFKCKECFPGKDFYELDG